VEFEKSQFEFASVPTFRISSFSVFKSSCHMLQS